MIDRGLAHGSDGVVRCWWPGDDPDYVAYHDTEWGRPVADDRRLFEKLSLELFQSGLSWLTILRKRDNFRRAFEDFRIERVARFGDADIARLLGDAGIVRHRGKIEATIRNAIGAEAIREDVGSLAAHVWGFEPGVEARPERVTHDAVMAMTQTPASRALAADLRRRGWRFVGPTTVYAFLQAAGVVNDHLEGCAARPEAEAERAAFDRPSATAEPTPSPY